MPSPLRCKRDVEDAQCILAEYFLSPLLGEAMAEHQFGYRRQAVDAVRRADVAVEVRSDRRRVFSAHIDDVLDVIDRLEAGLSEPGRRKERDPPAIGSP